MIIEIANFTGIALTSPHAWANVVILIMIGYLAMCVIHELFHLVTLR